MATVPRLSPGVENRPAPLVFQSSAGATAENFGAGNAIALQRAGQSLAQAGDVMGRLALQQQQDDNEREAKNLDVAFAERLRGLTLGDGSEANPGLYGQRGENALKAAPATQKAIEDARRELLGSTKNTRVQEMFGEISARRQEQEFGQISRFIGRERETANDATSEARMTSAAADAAADWSNPDVLARSTAVITGEISSLANRKGWAPEVTTLQLQTARTKMVTGMVQAAVRTDPEAAERIYNENRSTMLGTARSGIEQMLEQSTMAARSQKASDAILATHRDEGSALAAAKEITHAKLRDETTARIVAEFNRRQGIRSAQLQEAAAGRAAVSFRQGQADRARLETERAAEKAAVGITDNIMSTTVGWQARLDAAKALPPEVRVAVEKRLDTSRARDASIENADIPAAALEWVDKAVKQFPDDVPAQHRFIQENVDGKLRQRAAEEVDKGFRRGEAAQREQMQTYTQEAFQAVNSGDWASWQQNNPEKVAVLARSPSILENARKAEIDRINGKRYADVSEEGATNRLRQLPAMQLSQVNLQEWQYRLNQKDFDEMSRLVAGAKGRMEALGANRADYSRAETLLDQMAPELFGGRGQKPSAARSLRQNEIRGELDARITEFRQREGKSVPDDTLRQWATQVLIPVQGDTSPWVPWVGDFDRRAGEIGVLTEEQRKVITVPLDKVDPRVMADVNTALARAGVAVTDDRRQKLLRAMMLGSSTRIPAAERQRYVDEARKLTTREAR